MSLDRLKALVDDDLAAVNALIINTTNAKESLIENLSQHIIQSGGKRLRPLLVLLACHACNYKGQNHITLAAVIEFFHTATLLHDDVIDDSTLRRGKETANHIWGSKASILVGDFLYIESVRLLVDLNHPKIFRLMADTSHDITCAEIKQLSNRHNPNPSIEHYFDVIRAKTALLFAASACLGALLTEAPSIVESNLYAFGLHLGNAFQLIDDALDYCSEAEVIGKNIGDDLADGKATLPLLHALKHGTQEEQSLIQASLEKGSLADLDRILKAIENTKAIEYTRSCAEEEINKALTYLDILPHTPYKDALRGLAYFALERKY